MRIWIWHNGIKEDKNRLRESEKKETEKTFTNDYPFLIWISMFYHNNDLMVAQGIILFPSVFAINHTETKKNSGRERAREWWVELILCKFIPRLFCLAACLFWLNLISFRVNQPVVIGISPNRKVSERELESLPFFIENKMLSLSSSFSYEIYIIAKNRIYIYSCFFLVMTLCLLK